jgi:O-antigen ligase
LLAKLRAAGPAGALAIALLVAPLAAVLQSKALAPIATCGLVGAVALHALRHRTIPWPRGPLLWSALALFGWGAISALWALEPWRALFTAVQLGGYVALAAAGCRAVAEDTAAARRRLLLATGAGLALGLLAAGLDHATGNALRLAVRGLSARPDIAVGLKPAGSALALLLPLVLLVPGLPRWLAGVAMLAGAAILVTLPGEAAKLSVLVAALAGLAVAVLPRLVPRLIGPALALLVLAMPALLWPALKQGIDASSLPASSAHRLLIWDFALDRIAERPLAGWGLEASRRIPGGGDPAPAARLNLHHSASYPILVPAAQLALHPHNGPLQLWLELGAIGAALAAALAWLLGRSAARCAAPGVATAILAAAAVTGLLSFGVWQEWWISAQLLALAALASAGPRHV